VTSLDGTATQNIVVTINGADEPFVGPPTITPPADTAGRLGGVYYAFANDGLAPKTLSFDADNIFDAGGHGLTYVFTPLDNGHAHSWLTWDEATGTIESKDSGSQGNGPNGAELPTIFRIDGTDVVTHLTTTTYVAFTALAGMTFYASGFDWNSSNLYAGTFLPSNQAAGSGNVYIAAAAGSSMIGSNSADAFYGSENNDTIDTTGGGDHVYGGGGDDAINGKGVMMSSSAAPVMTQSTVATLLTSLLAGRAAIV
jgi:hypothetical protein